MMRLFGFLCLSVFVGSALGGCATKPLRATPSDIQPAQSAITSDPLPEGDIDNRQAASTPVQPIWQTAPDNAGVQHLASGYICPSSVDAFILTGEDTFQGLGHGNDVACIYSAAEGGSLKLHLTHFGRDVSLSAHLKGVQTSLADTGEIREATELPQLAGGRPVEAAAAYKTRSRSLLHPDIPVHTAVWIIKVGPWHVKARATYEADRNVQIGALVGTLFDAAPRTIDITTEDAPPQR